MWLHPIIQEKSDFVQWEGRFMEFRIQLRSAQDVQEFVSIALDVSQPLWVCPECDEAEYHLLKWDVGRFTLD